MIRVFPAVCALALAGLSACGGALRYIEAGAAPEVSRSPAGAPPGAAPGTCWGKHVTPAIIETVTHQVLMQPAEVQTDGTVLRPAIYKTETRQQIVRERKETWFETPCQQDMTPEFVASVQRALAARGMYRGAVTGEMDNRTRAAIRRFQKPQGLDSGILSLAAARNLGLVAVQVEG
ncbi:peptidoglycan-binding protein [Ruegeria sp. WL0004]|uniref:Peptidoglycan-binding protein n=1 Tax=Ruegeria marisflavi TaxID=2984152 RepID=A0ABT2WVS2_9RHOB|nr:peptidoglycan-binding domain-containing protein [Ruegeria sp. WL0004]MCU9839994.1 peptidoglycan-binding protein [Ruegeria sp. WL0004]